MEKNLTLKEIQQIELQILIEFSRICDEENLHYSLDSGTLLGAVRHKGFIPWDDDVDVIMLRSEYNRMYDIMKKRLPKRYKIIMNAQQPFAKILDLNTNVSNQYQDLYNLDKHLWIDIFPVDGIPNNEKETARLISKVKYLRKMQYWARTIPGTGSTPLRAIAKLPLLAIPKLLGARYYSKKIEKLLSVNKDTECIRVSPIVFSTKHPLIPRESFYNRVEISFCGYSFWAIPDWNNYLCALYGDYMQLPPENERKIHLVNAWLIDNE